MRHMSKPPLETESGIAPDVEATNEVGGFISGTGATLLSGLVSVFARRTVVPEDIGARVVSIGTSEALKFDR